LVSVLNILSFIENGFCFDWFQNNKLLYVKRSGEEVTVMEDDLRICMVRPLTDIERRFCFEVISPTKSHILQADTEELYEVNYWAISTNYIFLILLNFKTKKINLLDLMSSGLKQQDRSKYYLYVRLGYFL
jgi:hypothetical protein